MHNATPSIVSILSGKGGVGKSIITLNLLEALNRRAIRTLAIDADFACGNLHILANLQPQHGLWQVVTGETSLEEAAFNATAGPIICAERSISEEEIRPYADQLIGLLHQTESFDCILLDHASGISSVAREWAARSDLSALVVIPELTSIADAYGLYKCLRHSQVGLIANRVADADEQGDLFEKFATLSEQFLGVTPALLGAVPETAEIRKAVASQATVFSLENSQAAESFDRLALSIAAQVGRLPHTSAQFLNRTIHKPAASADIRG